MKSISILALAILGTGVAGVSTSTLASNQMHMDLAGKIASCIRVARAELTRVMPEMNWNKEAALACSGGSVTENIAQCIRAARDELARVAPNLNWNKEAALACSGGSLSENIASCIRAARDELSGESPDFNWNKEAAMACSNQYRLK